MAKRNVARWKKSYLAGSLFGLVSLSIALASVPRAQLGQETAVYQPLSEIRERKVGRLNFDGEIARLSQQEARFSEKLPPVRKLQRVQAPHPAATKRIATRKYGR